MIVIYNPIILAEAFVAGGLSFAASKIFPGLPKIADSLLFFGLLGILDLGFRLWLLRKRPESNKQPNEPITPAKPPSDWSWAISPKGGHLLFVPGWAIGSIASVFTLIL